MEKLTAFIKTDWKFILVACLLAAAVVEIGRLRSAMDDLRRNAGALVAHAAETRKSIGFIQDDVGALADDVRYLQEDVGQIAEDIYNLKSGQDTLNYPVALPRQHRERLADKHRLFMTKAHGSAGLVPQVPLVALLNLTD